MRKVCALFIVALMAIAASTAERVLAQDKATEVLNAMRQAIGGGRLDALRTFSLEAKTARNQGEMQLVTDVELYLDLPDRYLRVEHLGARRHTDAEAFVDDAPGLGGCADPGLSCDERGT